MKGQFFRRMLTSFAIIGMILVGRIDDASAGMITIKNHSFEDEVLQLGQNQSQVLDWTKGGDNDNGHGIGTWNDRGLDNGGHFVKSTLDGHQHAYLNGGSIAQQLSTGLVLGETYRLSALFSNGINQDNAAGGSLELWAGGKVEDGDVIDDDETSQATLLGSLVVPDKYLKDVAGHFVKFERYIVAPTTASLAGQLLSIRFVSNGFESEIDNIQLSTVSTAVPEPTSFALLGLGGCVLTISARRRKRSAAA